MNIKIDNISKVYDLPNGEKLSVLEEINLQIKAGEFVIILGESGCGKSTLLNIIAGLLSSSSGEIRVDDEIVTTPHPSISLLFQQPSLLPWLNVEENIIFGCKIRGDTKNLKERSEHFINLLGLSSFEKCYPHELSVGMAYRVSLARALIGHPKILLLDEPFTSLDTFTKSHVQEELIRIWQDERFTAIFVTHDIEEALLLGNKVIILGGRPCQIRDIININTPYPRDLANVNFFQARADILVGFRKNFSGNFIKSHPVARKNRFLNNLEF